MPLTIERLRLAIVALAVLLLLTITGSFFYGRWRLRRIAQDLPARLGIQIQQSTQGFVLSKTEGGRPLFTLHAARAVEFKSGGHVTLHDVEIDLYNRQDGKADTIAGSDFEYDPHRQIVQSQGEAHIVLHAPATNARTGAPNKEAGQVVRVTTHGLTFNQKTGVATCSGEVDFQIADSSGRAVGAEYDSKQGHLTLQSQIVLTTMMQNYPAVLRASQAVYDRSSGDIHLWQPEYTSRTQSGTMRGTAGTATVLLRTNGSVEQFDAQNNVRLNSANGLAVRAPVMHVLLNESNQPKDAHFSGGVEFAENDPAQKTAGSARETDVEFDARGRADRVALDGEVQIHQQAGAGRNELQRTLASNHLVMNLLPTRTGQAQLQSADAAGNAVFTSRSTVPGHAPQRTTLAAQTLKASFAAGNQLQQINGEGQTLLKTIAANGDIDSSSGDVLQIDFAPSQSSKPGMAASVQRDSSMHGTSPMRSSASESGPLAAQSIRTAVQTGNVVLQQTGNGKNESASGPRISTATAARASYVAANDTLTLTGDPVFRNAQIEMTAHRMEVNRTTGRMVSIGAVQTTLRSGDPSAGGQPGSLLDGKQPVHIIADHAVFAHDAQTAVFSGHARLWQGGDTVEAPVILLSQKMQTLTAYSERPCAQCVVSNFVGEPASPAPATKRKQGAETGIPSTFRVLSERLVYSDAERKASFMHHVQVVCSSGVMYADNAEIFLTPAERKGAANRNHAEQSSVERIVANGRVRLQQPGRSATGTKLVYTAADEHFVLTGDEKNPPQVVDLDHGTVTGQILTFASREQAIIVSGTLGHTTTTRTRVQKK